MLRDTVGALLQQGHKNIMLNLGRVTHIDSSGIGALVRALTTARSQGERAQAGQRQLAGEQVLRAHRLIGLFEVA